MKKREGDDKFMGQPMFPRLHVNDTEKGGPRAPPRNKMALYEQLTITSQSYNSGGAARNNQGNDRESRMNLPQHQPPLPPPYPQNEVRGTEVVNSSNQSTQIKQRMKLVEEDDLMVPSFSCHGQQERPVNNGGKKLNKESRSLGVSDAPRRYSEVSKKNKGDIQQRQQGKSLLSGSEETELSLCQDTGNDLPAVETRFGEGDLDPPEETENVDRDDVMSETSILNSASALEISSEDVVRMIGAKNFWRARNAIANQQRMLAAQVFELHRLMEVQGLVAGDPNLLLGEGGPFIGTGTSLKDSTKTTNSKGDPLKDSNVKKYSDNIKKKDDPKNPNEKVNGPSTTVSAPEPSPPVNTDPKTNPWSFQQPQWLVPVMCPSQGLVYKPCSTPSPSFGAHGPPFMNPPYGAVQMAIHYGGQGYFQPYGYGMPVIMSPSGSGPVNLMGQVNSLSQGDPHGQSGASAKNSSNRTILENKTTKTQGPGPAHLTYHGGSIGESELSETSSRVIKVVPRDRGSTREFAARIFRSIQEERRQQGSN